MLTISPRELFPKAVGVEVLVAGFLVVLFQCISDVKDAYHQIWPLELTGLRVFSDAAHYDFVTTPVDSTLSADPTREYHPRAECLGLKLRLPDDLIVITTVTHGFVHCSGPSWWPYIMHQLKSMFDEVKKSLMQYEPARFREEDAPFKIPKGALTNTPVGREPGPNKATLYRQWGEIRSGRDLPQKILKNIDIGLLAKCPEGYWNLAIVQYDLEFSLNRRAL
ncbi:hypothetical protein BDW59DRAFT_159776 [Aspergillus cavernicola]|uniref:Uncharacterized protein n=1 Tax=Aspergillus cavernicola TaxID=176166 RepID=A0ABR4IKA5_9EURO